MCPLCRGKVLIRCGSILYSPLCYQTVQSLAIGYAHKIGCSEKEMEELAGTEASMSEQALFLKVSLDMICEGVVRCGCGRA